ncbi:glycoside hydrolase family 88/105 protein [Gracilimonas mengyeensis]|uniref:Rhamnogalacturonyl hydrolase YesR n=1 Tax=Gracilimonas mengyeensis TaxID=1302730 RepID=A0A521BG08_9BACT|nr:glycoside hydrolase family 88 protein [Gracilimonas mengyeensis]SMO45871.1 Rhamnogalacturonyl hydrolase YesR [Gracilimonas mengyeensis]
MHQNNTGFSFPFAFIIILMGLTSCHQATESDTFWDEESSPSQIGLMAIDDLLSRDEIMRYETDFLSTVHYAEAIAGMGAIELAAVLGDTSRIYLLKERYQHILDDFDSLPADHVDANVIGVLPIEFYQWNGNEAYKKMGVTMADLQWDDPQPNGITNQTRYWIDDMFMIGIIQKKAYKVTGDTVYLNRAALQMNDYLEKLQRPNGLFYHGPDAPFFWGRGNGWMAAALAEMVTVIPEGNPHYTNIIESYTTMMESLLRYQANDGMWRQLIDNEDSWKESSGTAMFGYAIKVGEDEGILSDPRYTESYQKAWLALADKVNEYGRLTDICVGTGQSDNIQYYLDRPTVTGDLHGQAPLLWFAHQLLKSE